MLVVRFDGGHHLLTDGNPMTPDEHRARAEHLLAAAKNNIDVVGGQGGTVDRHIVAEVQALGTLAVAHALLAGQPPAARHVPCSEEIPYSPQGDAFPDSGLIPD
jgi:hypothetical protein